MPRVEIHCDVPGQDDQVLFDEDVSTEVLADGPDAEEVEHLGGSRVCINVALPTLCPDSNRGGRAEQSGRPSRNT